MWGPPTVYCPQPLISQTLDLNKVFAFFLQCCHSWFVVFFFFNTTEKVSYHHSLFLKTIKKVHFESPKRQDWGGGSGKEVSSSFTLAAGLRKRQLMCMFFSALPLPSFL